MSSKTKIVVLRMKEVIYAAIFILLTLILIILAVILLSSKNGKNNDNDNNVYYNNSTEANSETSDPSVNFHEETATSDTLRQPEPSADIEQTSSSVDTSASSEPMSESADESTDAFIAGVYSSSVLLNNNTATIEVVVDKDHINSIRFVNISEDITTMYPLIEPALDNIAKQVYDTQSVANISYSEDNKYTSLILINAISDALSKAYANTY